MYRPPPTFADGGLLCLQLYAVLPVLLLASIRGHALSRTMQKTSYYYCRHSETDEESRCHKMRLNAAELEQTVFLTLKKQMGAAAPLAPDGTLRVDASVPERAEYEQQIEAPQDGKRTSYERYLTGETSCNVVFFNSAFIGSFGDDGCRFPYYDSCVDRIYYIPEAVHQRNYDDRNEITKNVEKKKLKKQEV